LKRNAVSRGIVISRRSRIASPKQCRQAAARLQPVGEGLQPADGASSGLAERSRTRDGPGATASALP